MATELPVQIEFSLPDGWRAAPPDEVGAPGAAFVALHPGSADGFTANITIAGQWRNPALSMVEIADESVRRLEDAGMEVVVRDRREVGSIESPGLTQMLGLDATVEGKQLDLLQCQGYLSMSDVADPTSRAVIELILTSTPDQLDTVIDDYQDFVRSVRPALA